MKTKQRFTLMLLDNGCCSLRPLRSLAHSATSPAPLAGEVRRSRVGGLLKNTSTTSQKVKARMRGHVLFNLINPSPALRASSPARGEENRGFTLIELLVVVLIIGILAAVALPQYQKAVFKSRLAGPVLWAQNAEKALQLYVLQHGYNCEMGTGTVADCDFDIEINAGLDCTETSRCTDDYFSYDISMNPGNYSWTVYLKSDPVDTYFGCTFYENGTRTCSCADDDGYVQEGPWMCEMIPSLFPRDWN